MLSRNESITMPRAFLLASVLALASCGQSQDAGTVELTDAQVENIVRRSYQFVAMYNVNNKFATDPDNPVNTGGWNRVRANTALADHTLKAIARPNNDTLYIGAMLDLHQEPIILQAPSFDSKYVSLMVTGYDHYVNIPMSTRQGDFSAPSEILFYTERTPGYAGEAVEGVEKIVEMTGDFVSAVYRVMPHANEPERLQRNLDAMRAVKVMTLSEYRSGTAAEAAPPPEFPPFGKSDFDIFENNLLEVMQFVFNHTTFDPNDELDQKLLAVYEPLGVAPGRDYDPSRVAEIDGASLCGLHRVNVSCTNVVRELQLRSGRNGTHVDLLVATLNTIEFHSDRTPLLAPSHGALEAGFKVGRLIGSRPQSALGGSGA